MMFRITSFNKKLSGLFSDKTLTQKASLNAMASILDYGARWLVTFIVNPMLVVGLGNFGYGAWQVLERLIGYLSPAGGRPNQVLKWTIANHQASTDFEEKRRQVGSALAVWLMFLPLVIMIGGLVTFYLPSWLDAPPEFYSGIRWATAVLILNLIVTNLSEIPQSVLRGENLGYKRMGLTTLFVLLGGGLMALAMYFETGLAGVAIANLVATALTGVLFVRIVRTYVNWFGIVRPVFSAVKKFLGLSGWFLAWTLILQLLKAGDIVILGIFDSAELVTLYSLTRYIPEAIIGVVAIVVFGITPGLGGIIGKRDFGKATRVRNELMIFTWLIVTVFGSTMLLWNGSFVGLWVGSEHYAGMLPNLLIILMVSQFVFIRNDANIIDLTLDLRQKVLIGLLAAGVSAVMSVVLVGYYKMGIMGVTLGFITGQLIISVGFPGIVGRVFGISKLSQLKGILRPGVVTLLLFPVSAILGESLSAESWLTLIASVCLTVGLLSALSFFLGMTVEQRRNLLNRFRKVLRPS